MPLIPSLDLDNEYFRIDHISDAKDGRRAIAEFSAATCITRWAIWSFAQRSPQGLGSSLRRRATSSS